MGPPPNHPEFPASGAWRRWRAFRPPSGIRAALFGGFAAVFALWLLWGYELVQGLRMIERRTETVNESYARGEQLLTSIRVNVLLGSIYLRDALIDRAPQLREASRAELGRLINNSDELIASYRPDETSEAERQSWRLLQTELAGYQSLSDAVLGSATAPIGNSTAFLRRSVVPQRDTVLQALDQLTSLQLAATQRQRTELEALNGQLRTRLLSIGAATLAAAFVVALLASRQVERLQVEVERQRKLEQDNREDLERLSARLVQAQEQERRKLARDLHDEVGQALTAVKMDIGIALRSEVGDRARSALEEARDISETTLKSVRDMSQLLHPSALDDFGLPSTLATYVRSFSRRTGIHTELAESMRGRLSPEVELSVYRIVQEALNNVAQHSRATTCTVTVSTSSDQLLLIIEDNGRGLAPEESRLHEGFGLIGMRERAQALGGTFTVLARVEGGTKLAVELPLDALVAAPDPLEGVVRRAG